MLSRYSSDVAATPPHPRRGKRKGHLRTCDSLEILDRQNARSAWIIGVQPLIPVYGVKVPIDYPDQHSTTDCASPASLVSLYLPFMSFAVSANATIVSSRFTRCLDAISLVAIMKAVQAFTAPKAHRSMQGTCTKPATGSQVIPRWCSKADSAAFSTTFGSWS